MGIMKNNNKYMKRLFHLTYSISLSRQLDTAVLQLLHPLFEVSFLLHERGETMLEFLHCSLQSLMNFYRHSSLWVSAAHIKITLIQILQTALIQTKQAASLT